MFKSTHFYRATHYGAKRGLAIVCRPSVRPSVTLVDQDHICWQSWKLTARTIIPAPSLFAAQKVIHLRPGEHGEILRRVEVAWGKSGMLEHKNDNISETRKDIGKVTIVSGTGKATHFKFGQYIQRVHPNKSP